jgi:hypothetical protein
MDQDWGECFKDIDKIMAVVKIFHDLSPNLHMQ